jgi:quercetin dioxygenase-like cupin family protein
LAAGSRSARWCRWEKRASAASPSTNGCSLIPHLHETHPLFAACRHAAVGSVLADAPKSKNAKVTLVYQHELPNVPGKSIKGVLVEYGPGGYSPGHTHPKSAFIYATVLEGEILSQVNDGPVTTYKAGQSFSELPGDRHGVRDRADAGGQKLELLKLVCVADRWSPLRSRNARPVIDVGDSFYPLRDNMPDNFTIRHLTYAEMSIHWAGQPVSDLKELTPLRRRTTSVRGSMSQAGLPE